MLVSTPSTPESAQATPFAEEARSRYLRVLGIAGSLRRGSYNRALLAAAQELKPERMVLVISDVSTLPFFNEDLELDVPPPVREFKNGARAADAVLFATPEYNYSISAVLKNAIEWGNRPDDDNVWDGKPAAIMSASTSPRGGVRAQLHLRQILVDLNMHAMNRPQLLVARAQEKFDGELRLTDERTRELLKNLLGSLAEWTERLQGRTG